MAHKPYPQGLWARGLSIPDDVSVAGFDGMRALQFLEPKLCTIVQDAENIGNLAANRLMALIESPKTTIVEQIKVPGKLSEGHTICDLTKKKK